MLLLQRPRGSGFGIGRLHEYEIRMIREPLVERIRVSDGYMPIEPKPEKKGVFGRSGRSLSPQKESFTAEDDTDAFDEGLPASARSACNRPTTRTR
jgi:hypothetical protein